MTKHLAKIQEVLKGTSFWIAVIFIMAAFFRVFFLDLMEFKADEALSSFQTFQFFKQPYIIQTGLVSSIDTHNFPLFNYLLILLSLFSREPWFISLLIALLNSALVGAFYLVVKKYYGNWIAVLAALLLATS